MRITIRSDEAGRYGVHLALRRGTRVAHTFFGLLFAGVGAIAAFAGLPHTESLHCERNGDRTSCTSGQLLLGRWALDDTTLPIDIGAEAGIHHWVDEGDDHFRAYVTTPHVKLWYGKTRSDTAALGPGVQRINRFLADAHETSVDVTEDVWWWFVMPIGLLFLTVGLGLALIANRTDDWAFDGPGGRLEHRRRCGMSLGGHDWLMSDVDRVEVEARSDRDGDIFPKLLLRKRSGERVPLYGGMAPLGKPERAEAVAAEINHFLAGWRGHR